MNNTNVSIIIPAYNKGDLLLETYKELMKSIQLNNISYEIIIINDCSNDDTKKYMQILSESDKNVLCINNVVNIGLGSSIRAGINISKGDYLMWIPADNDIPHKYINNLISLRSQADMVTLYIVNRNVRGFSRNLMSSLYNFIYMLSFKIYLLNITSIGIYDAKLLKSIELKSTRFGITSEINTKMYLNSSLVIQKPLYVTNGIAGSTAFSLLNICELIKSFLECLHYSYVKKNISTTKLIDPDSPS